MAGKIKRIAAAVTAVLCMLTLAVHFQAPVKALADEEGVRIHVYNSLGWDNVYVYSWSDQSNAPELTPMTKSDGSWYEFTFSGDMGTDFEFLVYNGEWQGYNQTENIKVSSGEELYYVIQAELSEGDFSSSARVLSYDSEEEAAKAGYPSYTPEAEETRAPEAEASGPVTIYFKNVLNWTKAGFNAWGDNAASMAEMADAGGGWYSYTFDKPSGNVYNFMFYDVEAFAAETYGAGHQTGDTKNLTIDTPVIWVVPTEEGDVADGVYTAKEDSSWPGEGEAAPVSETLASKVYFKNSEGWSKVSIWAWTMKYTDQINLSPWPGDEMEDLGGGWFSYEIKTGEDYALLFNNGEVSGTQQTADSVGLKAGTDYWFVIGEGSEANESGLGGGAVMEVYTESQAGWPEGPEAEAEPGEEGGSPDLQDTDAQEETSMPVYVWIIGAAAVVLAAAGGGAVYVKKKRR